MVPIGIVLTGFAGLLIKRTIKGSVLGNGFEISDEHVQQIAAAGAVAGVAAASAVTTAQREVQ